MKRQTDERWRKALGFERMPAKCILAGAIREQFSNPPQIERADIPTSPNVQIFALPLIFNSLNHAIYWWDNPTQSGGVVMEIRKPDSKGRVVIGDDHEAYTVSKSDDGVITLVPLAIPDTPKLDRQDIRAVYVSPTGFSHGLATVTIHSSFGSNIQLADFVAEIANRYRVPVVCDGLGVGGGIADILQGKVEKDVIVAMLPTRKSARESDDRVTLNDEATHKAVEAARSTDETVTRRRI